MRNFIIVLSVLMLSSFNVFSQEKKVKVNGVSYVVDLNKGTACVGGNYRNKLFKCYDWVGTVKGDIVLASNIMYKNKSYPVTSIGSNAFMSCDRLNSVTVPNSICEIKYSSFSNANNLKKIIVSPDNN